MKRSNSLPKSVFTAFNDKIRMDEWKKSVSVMRPKYRGRFSLNKSDNKKDHGRRYVRQMAKEMGEEEGDDKNETFRIYNCLPLTEKSGDEGNEDKRKKSKEEMMDDRERLFNDVKILVQNERRGNNVVVHREEKKLYLIAHNEDYAFGDVLWLILRAYFTGNIGKNDDGAFEENLVVNNLRESKKSILDKISKFELKSSPVMDPFDVSMEYLEHLRNCKDNIDLLLEEWSSFQSLFPHSKGLLLAFPSASSVISRINLLTAVSTTIDDLQDKLNSLSVLLGMDMEYTSSNHFTILAFDKMKESIRSFVHKSLTVKGMSKVFYRVSNLCDVSIAKAVVLLKLPPNSYAEAVRSKSDGSIYNIYSDIGIEMNIVSPLPLFVFIQRIKLTLLEEWLQTRSEAEDAHHDSLTMDTLIEDSRDCLQQAISLRKKVMEELNSTCRCFPQSIDITFDRLHSLVFEKYIWYIRMWVESYSSEGRDVIHLFSRLEDELGRAYSIALSIPFATSKLCHTMLNVCTDVVRKTIIEDWQYETDRVNEEAATYDLEGNMDDIEDDDLYMMDDPSVLFTCRSYNSLLRSAQDRTSRVFGIIRRLIEWSRNSWLEEIKVPLDVLSKELVNYVLIESEDWNDKWNILVDSQSVDNGTTQDLIEAVGEGRKMNGATVIICPSLPLWNGRTTKINISLCHTLRFTLPLIPSNCILLTGVRSRCIGNDKSISTKWISSNDMLNQQLSQFSKDVLELAEILHSFVTQLSCTYSFSELSPHQIAPFRFTMMRAFDLCMQVYKDLSRLIVSSQLQSYILSCTNLISNWRRFLEECHPHPSKGTIPLWAMPALNFMQTVTDPILTRLLEDDVFKRLNDDVTVCKCIIMGRVEEKGYKNEGVTSPRFKKESREEGMKRGERMILVAQRMNNYLERRIRKVFVLGDEVVKGRDEYTIKNYIDPYRRAVTFKWRMLEQIGKGSYGTVYKAIREDGNGLLAVKIIKAERELMCVLESEVGVMRELKHINLVTYYGAEVRGDEVLILMEYCSEGTLEDICKEGMDTALVRKCTHSLLEALSFIHSHHIVHRDIKPANIFLSRCHILKLGDFGCARRLRGTDTAVGELKNTAGTLNYMAPEVLNYGGEKGEGIEKGYSGYGRAVDIWSVACVVIHMLSGHVPWEGYQWYHIVIQVGKGERPNYGKAGATRIVSEFLDSCFHHNPNDRLTAVELLKTPFANVQGSCHSEDSSPFSST